MVQQNVRMYLKHNFFICHHDLANAQRKWKNPIKKSPIINWAMHKKTVKAPYNQMEALPPGKLFGNPLFQLTTDEEIIPKPIQAILVLLFRKGPATTGIFRKSALVRTAKQIRQVLDQGKDVDFEEKSAIVLATVLKDFFRSMPDSLISSELYDDLVATRSTSETSVRTEQLKRVLQNLTKENYELTMRFMCVLHHIQRFSDRNNMNSYNLSICVSPSIMWPPNNSKLAVTEQASGSSDVVCFLIDNYVEIFSKENEYILGEESDIQLQDGPGEDSDSGIDQFIYRCRQTSMDDTEDDQKNDSEKENEPPMPDFSITTDDTNLESPFAHSDSSLGTNDSDDVKNSVVLNVPSISVAPETIGLSRSHPSSPTFKKHDMAADIKHNHSDMSDPEANDHTEIFQRRLLRQPRNKRVLSSTTTSAELIEHKRHMSESKVQTKVAEKKQNDDFSRCKTDNESTPPRSESPAGRVKVAKKSVISQPMIQHFATELYPTPNVIFHSVDRRRQPAAPSYEEHIQRTQAKHRIIQSTTVKQPVIAHATLVKKEPVESYQPLKPFVKVTAEKFNKVTIVEKPKPAQVVDKRITVERASKPTVSKTVGHTVKPQTVGISGVKAEKELNKNTNVNTRAVSKSNNTSPNNFGSTSSKREIQKSNIEDRFNSIVDSIHFNMPVSKNRKNSVSGSTSSVSSISSNMTSSSMETSPPRKDIEKLSHVHVTEEEDGAPVKKSNLLPTAPKPNRNKIQKLDLKSYASSTASSTSDGTILSDLTPRSENDNVFLSPAAERSPMFENPSSPFSLTLKSDLKKNTPVNSLDNRAHLDKTSLTHLEKTSLTKAPMKLEQLRHNNKVSDGGRTLNARELRKVNRRLKSEVRSAFNDGKFACKPTNGKATTLDASKAFKTNLNGHVRSHGLPHHDKTSVEQKNQENLHKQTTDLLEASKLRYNENNNLENISPHDAYKRILSQDESYV